MKKSLAKPKNIHKFAKKLKICNENMEKSLEKPKNIHEIAKIKRNMKKHTGK